jgi:hypothetical protein
MKRANRRKILTVNHRPLIIRARRGYLALVSFLVVSSAVFIIAVALAIFGVGEAQMGLAEVRGHRSFALAEGCAEDALLSAYYDGSYNGGTRSCPEGSCTVVVVKDGDNWTMTTAAVASDSGHTKKIEVKINRADEIVITGWKEIE